MIQGRKDWFDFLTLVMFKMLKNFVQTFNNCVILLNDVNLHLKNNINKNKLSTIVNVAIFFTVISFYSLLK